MKTKKFCLLVVGILIITLLLPVVKTSAHEKSEHYQDLEKVLFGDTFEKSLLTENQKKALEVIEAASYLALDQYNGYGKEELEVIQKFGVLGIPEDISEIDFTMNSHHRAFTHMGWDHLYINDRAHWETRKTILLETINKVFDFGSGSNALMGYDPQCEAFCKLVYYTHIIGDHLEDTSYKISDQKIGLGGRNDEIDIAHELLDCIENLFQTQKLSVKYLKLYIGLHTINYKLSRLVNSKGGVNSQEKFEQYQKCGEQMLKLLQENIPGLLQNETFFESVFSN